MKKQLLLVLLLLFYLKAQSTPLFDSVKNFTGSVLQYGKIEVGVASFQLNPSPLINPYDPADVSMYALFTDPNGKTYRRDAFWYQPFSRCNTCANNINLTSCEWKDTTENDIPNDPNRYLTPQTTSFPWRVRFAPNEVGTWSYKVIVHSILGNDTSASSTFSVSSSNHKGFS